MLGPILNISLKNINWVIVGGESGIRARPMELDWAFEIKNKCQKNNIPFFFKQFGGRKRKSGRPCFGKEGGCYKKNEENSKNCQNLFTHFITFLLLDEILTTYNFVKDIFPTTSGLDDIGIGCFTFFEFNLKIGNFCF